MYKLVLLLCLLGAISSVHVEVSNAHIIQRLTRDSGHLNVVLNRYFNKDKESLNLDYSTLVISDPPNSNYKAIMFTIMGTHNKQIDQYIGEKQSFILKVLTEQVPAPEYEIHKNVLQHTVKVEGLKNLNSKEDVETSLKRFANAFSDWTNNNMWGSSEQFYALHFLSYVFTKIAGRFYTNGFSCFLDFSAKDLHFSKEDSDPIQDYYADLPFELPKYFAITVSEKFFQEFLQEFYNRKKRLNLLEYLELFPEFDQYTERMTVQEASDYLPYLLERFNEEQRLSIEFNPKDPIQEGVEYAEKNIKVKFLKDSVDLLIPLIFDIVVGKDLFTWEQVGKGYMGLGGVTQIKQFDDGSLNFNINSFLRIQNISLKDTLTMKNIDEETGAIFALGNLYFKQNFLPPQTYHADVKTLLDLKWGSFNIVENLEKKIKMRFVEGYFEMKVDELETHKFPTDLGLVNKFGGVSEGFNFDSRKRKTAWENKQIFLEKEAKLKLEQQKGSNANNFRQEQQ
ncbi:UNKNOWN [Stylonychia lemnae]|uniref:Uncharacterized protein n=1 Tax=Stylonychia lemnae TaxID=5949 RepID=A0A078B4G0_STYLE|nr:UNKNOWN [Stylonychia lemnae]|eukprot:CDW89369.1 UNKNOWN [Stylonychia lemnae]